MRLLYNRASPFARKARIVAREAGVAGRIEEVDTTVSPVETNLALAADNPLAKIPTLLADDGAVLYDSRVICEYLDALGGGRLFPAHGAARWNALRLQSLCDGILDAAVLARYETAIRPEALRWADWIAGQRGKIERGLDALEREVPAWGGDFMIGQCGAAAVLGYLDFRFPDQGWRDARPALARWFADAGARPSVRETCPPA